MSVTSIKKKGVAHHQKGGGVTSDLTVSDPACDAYCTSATPLDIMEEGSGRLPLGLRVATVLNIPPQLTIGTRTPSLPLEDPIIAIQYIHISRDMERTLCDYQTNKAERNVFCSDKSQ